MKLNNIFKIIGAILICQAAGVIGTIFTIPAIPIWYAALQKPSFAPPNWLFGPVWLVLYALMGIALYLIWKKRTYNLKANQALVIFFIQLALNSLWSFLFFGLRNPLAGLVGIVALWFAIVWAIIAFFRISRPAAYLLVPYILWVSLAAYLNYSIFVLN